MSNLFPSDALNFRKSSYSERNNCVEVAALPGGSAVRDSQNPDSGHLEIPAPAWATLLAGIRSTR